MKPFLSNKKNRLDWFCILQTFISNPF